MHFWERLFRREHPNSSSDLAKERLQLVLVHDRSGLNPEMLHALRDELIAVLSKYIEIESGEVEVELSQNRSESRLVANIPLRPRPPTRASSPQPHDLHP